MAWRDIRKTRALFLQPGERRNCAYVICTVYLAISRKYEFVTFSAPHTHTHTRITVCFIEVLFHIFWSKVSNFRHQSPHIVQVHPNLVKTSDSSLTLMRTFSPFRSLQCAKNMSADILRIRSLRRAAESEFLSKVTWLKPEDSECRPQSSVKSQVPRFTYQDTSNTQEGIKN